MINVFLRIVSKVQVDSLLILNDLIINLTKNLGLLMFIRYSNLFEYLKDFKIII